jgi:hypothetical protein
MAGHCWAWLGMAGHGWAWLGMAGQNIHNLIILFTNFIFYFRKIDLYIELLCFTCFK